MMYRKALKYLNEWKIRPIRMPLVIRGARQVGKSSLVRIFAKESFENFIEINLESDIHLREEFSRGSAKEVISKIELRFNKDIIPGKTLIFLDEIQSAPSIFAKLRYFHEDFPEIHFIAAGSLLEFVLEEHKFSMPVGRVEYLHLGPMTFNEFLLAAGKVKWVEYMNNYSMGNSFPEFLHNDLLHALQRYIILGGMPKVIDAYIKGTSLRGCDIIKGSIIEIYIDDFSKYGKRINHQRLLKIFQTIPRLVGQKFRYVNISRNDAPKVLGKALHMLELARVCNRIIHSRCQGVPLGADIKDNVFKLLFLDIGLLLSQAGLNIAEQSDIDTIICTNNGALAEQFIGQHLLYMNEIYKTPQLYYWTREKASSNAEIDYVISSGMNIIPIEVKSGTTGSLRSLHQFIYKKELSLGVRLNRDLPSSVIASGKLTTGENYKYKLLSLPLYMIEQTKRIVKNEVTIQVL